MLFKLCFNDKSKNLIVCLLYENVVWCIWSNLIFWLFFEGVRVGNIKEKEFIRFVERRFGCFYWGIGGV